MLTRDAFQTLYDQGPDAVFALIHAFQHQIAVSQEQNAALSARIKVLEDHLATDSHNSSKPPSSDALAQKASFAAGALGTQSGWAERTSRTHPALLRQPRPDYPSRPRALRRLRERARRGRSRPHAKPPGRRCAPACTRHHRASGGDQSLRGLRARHSGGFSRRRHRARRLRGASQSAGPLPARFPVAALRPHRRPLDRSVGRKRLGGHAFRLRAERPARLPVCSTVSVPVSRTRRWRTSTRRICAWKGVCTGCTAPARRR